MSDFTLPLYEKQTGDSLFDALGSFWNSLYDGVDFIEAYTRGLGLISKQTNIELNEMMQCWSRVNVPLYNVKNWYKLELTESEKETTELSEITTTCPLPAGLHDVSVISNRITSPSLVMIKALDYTIDTDEQTITFKGNPFENPLIAYSDVFDRYGAQTDRVISLWLYRSQWDNDLVYRHFGSLVGIDYDTGQNYKDLVNAIFDSSTGFATQGTIDAALSAITDLPLALTDGEKVEFIQNDHSYKLVITDSNVYRFPTTAIVLVDIGDTLTAGQAIVDGLRVYDFTNGTVPDSANVPSITVPEEYLQIAAVGDLTFGNSSQAVTVTSSSGFTKITFPLTGDSGDITLFWNTVHSRGIAASETLAHLLDTRGEDSFGEPSASDLPANINPAEFLVANVFRNNLLLVIIDAAAFGANTLGVDALKYLRKIVPPYKAVLVQDA